MSEQPTSAPVAESERYESLDFFRGVALCGILMVNIFAMGLPTEAYTSPYIWGDQSALDFIAFYLTQGLVQMKFFSLFSLLFGAGLWLQTERMAERGVSVDVVYVRRLIALAAFGVGHALLLWWGDILFFYAAIGFFLFFIRKFSTTTLRNIAIGALVLPLILCYPPMIGFGALAETGQFGKPPEPEVGADVRFPVTLEDAKPYTDDPFFWKNFERIFSSDPTAPLPTALQAHYYANGTYLESATIRALWWIVGLCCFGFLYLFPVVGYMTFGIVALRSGLLTDPAAHQPLARKLMIFGLGAGLPITALGLVVMTLIGERDLGAILSSTLLYLGSIAQTAGYLGVLATLAARPGFLARVKPLVCMGRMALTNYLSHSLVFAIIMLGWGFGLYGSVGYAGLSAMAAALLLVQAVVSPWWLGRFRYGPMEWLWRCFTYWRVVSITRKREA